jgi:hypothetical protein
MVISSLDSRQRTRSSKGEAAHLLEIPLKPMRDQ